MPKWIKSCSAEFSNGIFKNLENMHSFELIAIKPLVDCDKKYCKVLKPGETYWFINDYSLKDDGLKYKRTLPINFYSKKNPNIQISAIVGKNGSGKSSIIELLMMVINNLAKYYSEKKIIEKPLEWANEGDEEVLSVEIYFKTDKVRALNIHQNKIAVYEFKEEQNTFTRIDKNIVESYDLKDFFYSIVVNYSHFGLDSCCNGNWLIELFHKNDGYQVPIVINPFREDGTININREHSLAKARLLTNIVSGSLDSEEAITDNLKIGGISLKPTRIDFSTKKIYSDTPIIDGKPNLSANKDISISNSFIDRNELLEKLNAIFDFGLNKLDQKKYKNALDYLIYKLVRIAINYEVKFKEFYSISDRIFHKEKLKEYLYIICYKEDSHITYKFRQTLNFLKYQHFEFESKILEVNTLTKIINEVLSENKIPEIKRIELIPPPIFDVDYHLVAIASEDNSKSYSSFELLSSGEKQLIYSLNSIYYHLRNINSVRKDIITYKNINIVFEEIEMYFHPEFQRKFICQLIKGVKRIGLSNEIAMHFCFVTHSPFILSDIPNSNIMFLEYDENEGCSIPKKGIASKTFGANIHMLLRDSFFMQSGLIGEYAKDTIHKLIDNLKTGKPDNEIEAEDERLYSSKIIEILGEPLLKDRLIELYRHKFESDEALLKERDRINEILKKRGL